MAGSRRTGIRRAVGRIAAAAMMVSLIGFGAAPQTALADTTVTFATFSDLSPLALSGSTAAISNPVTYGGQSVLRLTNALGQAGGAFLANPISLQDANGFKASFSTAFQFQLTNPMGCWDTDGVQGADGLVFVVQTHSNQYGGPGEGIGYRGIPNSVGIEFDTWNNGGQDGNDGNHVGVDLNGDPWSVARQHVSEAAMNNGGIWYAWIDYDGDSQNLEVRVTQSATRPATPTLSYAVDLTQVLGQPDAYVGFTSGTGCAGNNHDIRAWQFTNTFHPIDNVCQPVSALSFMAPLSTTAAADMNAGDPLAIRFRYGDCTLDSSVTVRIRNAATNTLIAGYTYGYDITFDPYTGLYAQDFVPSQYGIAPGTQLKVMVYFGTKLKGSALVNVH